MPTGWASKPHRFPPELACLERCGRYNVGWVSFRNDATGLSCAQWWRARCLEWCYDRLENGRYADQRYLDEWPTRFEGVRTLEHKGANLAPWNVSQYTLSYRSNAVWVDDDPLVFYHFHGLRRSGVVVDPQLWNYHAKLTRTLRENVYRPYLRCLLREGQGRDGITVSPRYGGEQQSLRDRVRVLWQAVRNFHPAERLYVLGPRVF
jgi:hypothetical protein